MFPISLRVRALLPAIFVALLALACIPWSKAVYHAVFGLLRSLPLKSFYAATVQFPSATAMLMILAIIWIYQKHRRATVIVFLVALLFSTTVNESIKALAGRARPRYSIIMGHRETKWVQAYLEKHPDAGMKAKRVDQWLGPGGGRDLALDEYRSFPSGHANSSFTMAAYLCALFPEARVVWLVAAGGCALARVEKTRHWPEDVLFGGALGWLISQLVFSWRWPLRLGLWLLGDWRSMMRAIRAAYRRIASRRAPPQDPSLVNPQES